MIDLIPIAAGIASSLALCLVTLSIAFIRRSIQRRRWRIHRI